MPETPDADLLNIFWVEVGDYLQSLNNSLLQIEAAGSATDTEKLREMNRLAHSMKGAARAVGIHDIETIAHKIEDLFDAALKGRLNLTPIICDLVYDGLDLIQNVVNGGQNDPELVRRAGERLESAAAAASATNAVQEIPAAPRNERTTATTITRTTAGETTESSGLLARSGEETIRVPLSRMDRLMNEMSELVVARMHAEERQRELQRLAKLNRRWQRDWRGVRTAYIRLARRMQHQADTLPDEVETLFRFLETNQRYLIEMERQFGALTRAMAYYNSQLGMLTEQLQDDIGSMRLLPFDTLASGLQRMVRDLARDTGKDVLLEIIGAHVEMDKTVLDALKEPIMHLLRNAIDHGLESTAERVRLGKPAEGRLRLTVEQRGKEFLVSIRDDGRGLDTGRIIEAGVRNGLLTAQEANTLSQKDAYNLIFVPGLTTRDEVSALSGRGIGMDVVRTRVESLRGRVTIESFPGSGTTFTLALPASLTRIACILLRSGDQDFAVPSVTVTRMLKVRRDELFSAEGHDLIMINERPTAVASLDQVLGLAAANREDDDEITLMVLSAGDRSVAFEVTDLYSEEELVLKQLGPEIAGAPFISGAALLGTGDIIIVLDPNDLIRAAGGQKTRPRVSQVVAPFEASSDRPLRVLIVDDSITTRTLEKHILESAGCQVVVAVDGLEAWDKLGDLDVDVVVSDVEMPRMNGLELTEKIKGSPHTRRLPVILLTSLGKPEQREAGLKAGADAYLIKSRFDQGELLRVIRTVV